jgi:hypothetical protein
VAAETENASCGKVCSKCFVMEVFPAPDGAVTIMILFAVLLIAEMLQSNKSQE